INQGRIIIDREEVSLQQVLDRAIEATEARLERQDQHLIKTIPQRTIIINVDAARITQVVTNLVDNASKYSAPGSRIWLEARVNQDADDNHLILEVRDEGEGIDPELLPDVFDLFTQADVPLDRSRGGLGLGLSLVKQIVELHGGQVSAHSEGIGRGSRFVVDLPVVVSAPHRAMSASGANTLDNARILVVDDRPDLADSLTRLLESRGATVHTAHTGAEALEQAARHEPTHILLDIGLPDIDGYEVGRRLRQHPAGAKTSLIALTGYGRPRDVQKAREAGFDHHLTKPAHLSELLELIAEPAVDERG
ncbi:MAG: ATP-binding protein, partial [Persicimonas sp.]